MAKLDDYIILEKAVLTLDEIGSKWADEARNVMDAMWLELSPEDQDTLNKRHLSDVLREAKAK